MIYPFTVVKTERPTENGWALTIKYQKVEGYEATDDPANQFKYPIISDIEGFFYVEADTEEAALEEVAKRVANP